MKKNIDTSLGGNSMESSNFGNLMENTQRIGENKEEVRSEDNIPSMIQFTHSKKLD